MVETRSGSQKALVPTSFASLLTPGQRVYSRGIMDLMVLFDVFSDSDRHAALLLNKALSREGGDMVDARTICESVTRKGIGVQEEIKEVLHAYNVLYGFVEDKLAPGILLDPSITSPRVESAISDTAISNACREFNVSRKDAGVQVDARHALATVDRNPERTVHFFLDDVGTPRQTETRRCKGHDGRRRSTKTVTTTNGVIVSAEGIYYLSAESTREMCMMARGFMLKNRLLEDRELVVFSDGARPIRTNVWNWFSFRGYRLLVDWYHLVHKGNELFSTFLLGGKKHKEESEAIKREYFAILWTGEAEKAIEYLESIDASHLKSGRSPKCLVDYMKGKMEHHTIPVFAIRQRLGQFNSSSMSETANFTMTTSRQKKQGKSWSTDGSHAKTTLRNVYANHEEENMMEKRAFSLAPVPSAKVAERLAEFPRLLVSIPDLGENQG